MILGAMITVVGLIIIIGTIIEMFKKGKPGDEYEY